MKTEQLTALAPMHAYKDITIDREAVAREFCGEKNRMLNFGLSIKLDLRYLLYNSSAFSPVVLDCTLEFVITSN